MKEKMKSRRRVAPRTPAATTATTDDPRRVFLERVLTLITSIPDNERLPQSVRDEIRTYSRSRVSEKPVLRIADLPAHAVRHVVAGLLRGDPGANLSVLIEPLLREVRLTNEELRYADRDTRVRRRIADYAAQHLSAHLLDPPTGALLTDVPLAKVEADSPSFFDEGDVNDLAPLFHAFIPDQDVKRFIATLPADRSVQRAVSRFVQQHQFTPIQKLFESGFRPASPRDWKDALPPAYYEKFPPALWHLKEWEQFRSFAELSRQHSLDLSEFIKYAFYKGNEKLIRLGQEARDAATTTTTTTAATTATTTITSFYNTSEVELMQRTRPWVDKFVSVLVQPVSGCDAYVGRPYGATHYFPTDAFFRDLANQDVRQEYRDDKTLVMTHAGVAGSSAVMRVSHLLSDGQVVPQTRRAHEEGARWIASGRARLTLPHVKEHMLALPFEDLAPADREVVLGKMRGDLTFFLSRLLDDQLDLDAISDRIVSSAAEMTGSFRDFLSHVFQLYFLMAPRYNVDVVSGVVRDRLNFFFYRLDSMCELPVEFYYPQFPFLVDQEKESFMRWKGRCLDNFILETLASLFARNYPVLRVRVPDHHSFTCSPPAKLVPGSVHEKLSLMHPFQGTYLYLPEVASALLSGDEYLVNGSPLPSDVASSIEKFFDLPRVRAGLAALMMDNEYEVATTTRIGTTTTTTTTITTESALLDGFRENAYRFLETLRQN